ncbi:MAG: N-acetylmuramoyl-L-alanine amidase [bacterium]|nr:N-acetylmuramoyl-L-alanine amidase [bacterium]
MPGSMTVRHRPSPNANDRRTAVSMLVLHYTGMQDAEAALQRLVDPSSGVSAHWLVDEDGEVTSLVPEARRAWHAGAACWQGVRDVNGASVGIEIVNPGHAGGLPPFPARQMDAVAALSRDVLARHGIRQRHVLGHSDVAPLRKQDPGELFDWRWLASQGVGLWPPPRPPAATTLGEGDRSCAVQRLQEGLASFGYAVAPDGDYGAVTVAVVTAFQRHFRPARVDGVADGETAARLAALVDALH